MKKDVKKSSYYVWFLGAHECKNVRDVDGALPAVAALADREKKVTPHKFTLQVSHRGLKIVHNVSAALSGPQPPPSPPAAGNKGKGSGGGGGGGDQLVKHLIPDHAVTCVHRDGDLVAVILLLYNPVTRWPVHVHAYRCDSAETAALLTGQLRALVDRPENRKKLDEIELRLEQAYGTTSREPPSAARRIAADVGSSCSSPPARHHKLLPPNLPAPVPPQQQQQQQQQFDDAAPGDPRVTALYDSLAAELKEKLGTGRETGAPILLPPRDYDTVHRHRGNLNGIDFRRCMSANIVGVNGAGKPVQQQQQQEFRKSGGGGGGGAKTQVHRGSSGGSSGIGSDHAPSPEQYEPDTAYADNDSSSDEDWNASPSEEPVFAKPSANHDHHPLPRVRRQDSGVDSSSSPVLHASPEKDYYYGRPEQEEQQKQQHFGKRPNQSPQHGAAAAAAPNPRDKYSDRCNVALVQPRPRKACDAGTAAVQQRRPPAAEPFGRKQPADAQQRRRTPSPCPETPRERFKDAKEKFLMLEKERMDEQRSALRKCAELRQRRDNGAAAAQRAQVIRAAVRGERGGPRRAGGYGSGGDETAADGDRDRGYDCGGDYDGGDCDDGDHDGRDYDGRDYGHGFDGNGPRNVVRRSDRSRENLLDDDRGYRGDGYPKPRRSRNVQPQEPCRPAAPRSYSADDEYAERRDRNRPSRSPPAADRYKSPQRRTAAEAPRAAPRRNHNGYGDVPPSPPPPQQQQQQQQQQQTSRANDYKRRPAYAYAEDVSCCDGDCSLQSGRRDRRPRDAGSADDGGPLPVQAGPRDYKRRSAAAAYDDRGYRAPSPPQPPPPQPRHPRAQQDFGRRADQQPPAVVSPRYRHSYAESYRHHHAHRGRAHQQRPQSPVREPPPAYHRHGGGGGVASMQPSGRIGIAAIHPY